MRPLAKLYPKGDFADRATAIIADIILLTMLLGGGLYLWHSARPIHDKVSLPQVVISPRDQGAGPQPAQPIPFVVSSLERFIEGVGGPKLVH